MNKDSNIKRLVFTAQIKKYEDDRSRYLFYLCTTMLSTKCAESLVGNIRFEEKLQMRVGTHLMVSAYDHLKTNARNVKRGNSNYKSTYYLSC